MKAGTIIDPNEKDTETLRKLGSTAIKSFMSGVPALEQLKNSLNETILNRGYLLGLDRRPLYCRSEYKALNVLLQAAGAVIMKQVVVNINKKLRDRGLIYGVHWQQHAFIHDEIQLSCIPSKKDLVVESCLESFPEAGDFFEFRCPIHGDAKTGFSWSDTH
jgi:DNA polymerase I-like protein with 3'-5' exonuclease and polymerase domains